MSDRITKTDLKRLASTCNVHIATWSPGDGMTRYRMIAIEGNSTSLDFFGASGSDVLGTCLGLRDAYTWLQGYRASHLQGARRLETVKLSWTKNEIHTALEVFSSLEAHNA